MKGRRLSKRHRVMEHVDPDAPPVFNLNPDATLIGFDGHRIVFIRPSQIHREILRIYSTALTSLDLETAKNKIGYQPSDVVIVKAENTEHTNIVSALFPSAVLRRYLPDAMELIISAHQKRTGTHFHFSTVSNPPPQSENQRRIFDRLGDTGYALLSGASTFAGGKAAYRLIVKSYQEHKRLEGSVNRRDSLVQEMIGWNIVSQAYMSLENLAALYAAMRAACDGDYKDFAETYLHFGKSEGVSHAMGSLLGKRGPEIVARILNIPVDNETIESSGLAGCGIDADDIITLGKETQAEVLKQLRGLANDLIEIDPISGNQIKTVPVQAYAAFRHGFKVAFPLHEPRLFINSSDAEQFETEEQFLEHRRKMHTVGELLYLGERLLDGKREVVRISGPTFTSNLKQFVQLTWRTGIWLTELTQYAASLYGSVDGRFPYLINATDALGPERASLLRKRLDALTR